MKALGDYCGGVPPLPIPNREVKTASADGTAHQCGRVGRRHSLETPFLNWDGVFLFQYATFPPNGGQGITATGQAIIAI